MKTTEDASRFLLLGNPERVRRWLKEQQQHDPSYTQAKLAERLHNNEGHLSRVLNGEAQPSPELLVRMAKLMGVDPLELIIPPDKALISRGEKRLLEELEWFVLHVLHTHGLINNNQASGADLGEPENEDNHE